MNRAYVRAPGRDSVLAMFVALLVTASCESNKARREGQRVEQVFGRAGTLHVDDGGEGGLPVVFVHSFGGNTEHWQEQLAHLRRDRRAVALDLRGHGRSAPPPDGDYAIQSFADDIGAVVDGLGLERFVLVGHSLGGAAASAYAGAHPERVAGLVLVGTPGRVPEQQARQIKTAMYANYDRVSQEYWTKLLTDAKPEVRTRIEREMHSVPREASLAIIDATLDYDPLPALERYTGPKLIVTTGKQDSPNDLHNLAPKVKHERVYGTSHWPHMDDSAEFDRVLDAFLADVK